MRVRIISYEDLNSWILGKFAIKLHEELISLGCECDIGKVADPSADINHHIIYTCWDGGRTSPSGLDTVMITHVDSIEKVGMLKAQIGGGGVGICMSRQTLDRMIGTGLERTRLCYVSPAHDSVMRPRRMVLGITSKVYDDGRKNEGFLTDLARRIRPDDFSFRIMGSGWDAQVAVIRAMGFEVIHHPDFDRTAYLELMPSLDYYLYTGHDEGSMGYIDALAAGVRTIVTPQGFHLDALGGLTHPIMDSGDLAETLGRIAAERARLPGAVQDWTWRNYALKHLEIWEHLLGTKPPHGRPAWPGPDGLPTLLSTDPGSASAEDMAAYRRSLARNSIRFTLIEWKQKLGRGRAKFRRKLGL